MAMNMEKALAKKVELESKGKKVPYMKLEEGQNVVRILPPFGNRELPWVEFAVAYNIGPMGKKRSFTPRAQFGLDCALQKYIEQLQAIGDAASKKEVDAVRPKNKFHLFVVNRKDEASGPQHLTLPPKVMADVLTIMADPDFGDITHPDIGTDITINYKKATSKSFPEYHITPKRNSSPLIGDPVVRQQWLAVDLFDDYGLGKPADNDYIKAVIEGKVEEYVAAKKGVTPVDIPDAETDVTAELPSQNDTSFAFGANAGQVAAGAPASVGVQANTFSAPAIVQPPQPHVEHSFAEGTLFWAAINGTAVQQTLAQISESVLAGQNPMLMTLDQSSGWKDAASLGFRIVRPTPPPPVAVAPPPPPPVARVPTAPPATPATPPSPSAVAMPLPGDEAAALQAQLSAFQNPVTQSQVGADLAASLK